MGVVFAKDVGETNRVLFVDSVLVCEGIRMRRRGGKRRVEAERKDINGLDERRARVELELFNRRARMNYTKTRM